MNRAHCALLALPLIALSAHAADIAFPVERPTLATGDTFTMQRKDIGKNEVTGTSTITISGRNDSGYTIAVNQAPDFSANPIEALSPDLGWRGKVNGETSDEEWLQFPLTQGKTWKSHGLWQIATGYGFDDTTFTVAGIEDVTVPAGTFKAVRMDGKGWWTLSGTPGGTGRVSASGASVITIWYSPEAKAIVRLDINRVVPRGVNHYAFELTTFKVQ